MRCLDERGGHVRFLPVATYNAEGAKIAAKPVGNGKRRWRWLELHEIGVCKTFHVVWEFRRRSRSREGGEC